MGECWSAGGRAGCREVLERSVELDGAERSPEVNEEAGRVESVFIACKWDTKILYKLDMTGHKYCFESWVKV